MTDTLASGISHLERRIEDAKETLRAESAALKEVIRARLKHLEERE